MGQSNPKITTQWADGPFKLLESPRHARRMGNGKESSGAINVATDMALVHNFLIRGLNCIYLQAPFIPAELRPDFIKFMQTWTVTIHHHHMGEEEKHFPWLEEDIGIPGYMQASVDQHHEFEPGLKAFEAHVVAVKEGTEEYDGQKVRDLIDGFAIILTKHLAEEIEALVGLEKFDAIDWVAYNKRVSADAMANTDTISRLNPRFMEVCGLRGRSSPAGSFDFGIYRSTRSFGGFLPVTVGGIRKSWSLRDHPHRMGSDDNRGLSAKHKLGSIREFTPPPVTSVVVGLEDYTQTFQAQTNILMKEDKHVSNVISLVDPDFPSYYALGPHRIGGYEQTFILDAEPFKPRFLLTDAIRVHDEFSGKSMGF
ncbi:hypothetical protein GLAREA_12755 [Glarea lozoyensis ATCC 20868]|uniref:Hemerythrin-like domain-containing protein n=1 Tax=Glarea lozoyensis (strain ATCC 20868 / MF5171) TaxID=1116229 RepID=S3CYV2_GLAL2|nr:uncharacterized protein GLAREA_12755 [Glarea lozoyensis ATCC 20868]EPE31452.1 hypothetical protein GLAREA_12755 [Glarea lozoyensis ATCC 20868]